MDRNEVISLHIQALSDQRQKLIEAIIQVPAKWSGETLKNSLAEFNKQVLQIDTVIEKTLLFLETDAPPESLITKLKDEINKDRK